MSPPIISNVLWLFIGVAFLLGGEKLLGLGIRVIGLLIIVVAVLSMYGL